MFPFLSYFVLGLTIPMEGVGKKNSYFCFWIKAAQCHRIFVFFKKSKYFHAFSISEIWCVWQIRNAEPKYPTIFNPIPDKKFYFAHQNAWPQNQQLFTYVSYSQSIEKHVLFNFLFLFFFFPQHLLCSPKTIKTIILMLHDLPNAEIQTIQHDWFY